MKEAFICPNLIGGLGNQMFITATAYSYHLDNNIPIILKDVDKIPSYGKHRPTYWNTMFHKLQKEKNIGNLPFLNESELKKKIVEPKYLNGYCQNVDYFHHNYDKICELFTLPDILENKVNNLYDDIIKKFNSNTVSVHIRGIDDSTPGQGNYYREIMPIEFFKNAMQKCDSDSTFIILTNNVDYCKSELNGYNNIYFAEETDYIELKLMSKCKNHIMPISTFSWWGAYLNRNNNKKIYVPNPENLIVNEYNQKAFHYNFHRTLFQRFNNIVIV
tara:strand:- start:994 stop:1815 length:822 start_codon:yes stop_codon:yes gene_type:complete